MPHMRAKHVLERLHLNHHIRVVYQRVTLTKFTLAFVIIAILGCFVQIGIQGAALNANSGAKQHVDDILNSGGEMPQFAFIQGGILFTCASIPHDGSPFDAPCYALAGPGVSIPNNTMKRFNEVLDERDKKNDDDDDDDEDASVTISRFNSSQPDQMLSVSRRCLKGLNWPATILHDSEREDISFLVFQIWLLGVSFVTVLNESIPHLVAAVVTHGLATAWSAFQVSRIGRYMDEYQHIVVNDVCDGVDVMPNFWGDRIGFFVPILIINAITWFATIVTAVRLFKLYSRQSFQRVGASKTLNVRYICILLFSVFLQLSAFFTVTGSALWIDAICSTVFEDSVVYRVIFTIVCVLELPWAILGWHAYRKENTAWSIVFIVIGLAITAAWSSMFASVLYQWMFRAFPFFATVTTFAFIILIGTVGLAVVCQFGFGLGLPKYLKSEEKFDDSSFVPVMVPKPASRSSRLVSVIFPDKRVSALRKKQVDAAAPRPSMSNSVIDIKNPNTSRQSFDTISDIATISDGKLKPLRLTSDSSDSISVPERARSVSSRFSNASASLGKHLSSMTMSSLASDAERGEIHHAQMTPPPVPALPKFTTALASPPKSYAPGGRASDDRRAPAINVIPASVSRSMSLEQRALHTRNSSQSSTEIMNFRPPGLSGRGRVGLPGNPRPYQKS